MNPLTARSQIKGGATMGIGMALHEDLVYDRRSGSPLSAGYYGARVATHRDAPEIDVIFIESDDGLGPFGAKSMGESSKVPAPAAVANAVFNAIGIRMKDLPITRDKIVAALAMGGAGMKSFTNANPRDLAHAVTIIRQARQDNRSVAIAGGGSDLLGMMKERLVTPDVLVSLKSIKGLDQVKADGGGVTIGGLITLDALARRARWSASGIRCWPKRPRAWRRRRFATSATLAGNICQRPWCWYYRNGFTCLKNGGTTCYSVAGENEFHAIFGGGPSYIVHPSDTAPALVALDATFRIAGPAGERVVPAAEFFTLPTDDASRENVLKDGEMLASITLPAPRAGVAQHVSQGARSRSVDARRRQRRDRARDGQGRLPQRARRARRRRADSVAAAGGREDARRPARHAGAGGEGGRGRGRRRAAAGEERLQGADDARDGRAHHPRRGLRIAD